MISLVVYGRNDSYGYNLHKRAALSLNCIAEMLSDDDDEIIFVDYNSPNDHPTFPEAIRDTLTENTRRKLRILRIRPRIHHRFRDKTPLPVLEAIARNVGIRRSRSANRWILSTNTDMIFVSRSGRSLNEIARNLPSGLYHAPRIEVPETLWESLDRADPQAVMASITSWGLELHLNEIVHADKVLYDGPGDFQLVDRQSLFANRGFHEGMLLGWHLDSNLAIRMNLFYGTIGDLGHELFGYHCDHTRQLTLSHSQDRQENSWSRFIDGVDRPDVPEQAETWGCAGDEIEEISLIAAPDYVAILRDCVGAPQAAPLVADYSRETYDHTDYDPRHVLPFLVDLFVSAERNTKLAWIGFRPDSLSLFAQAWGRLEFSSPILLSEAVSPDGGVSTGEFPRMASEALADVADTFVFDLGGVDGAPLSAQQRRSIGKEFLRIVRAEQERLASAASARRVVCINTANTSLDPRVAERIATGLTPFSTRLRHGVVLAAPAAEQDWLAHAQIGPAGIRDGGAIRTTEESGVVCYGPRRHLFPGSYALHVGIGGQGALSNAPDHIGVVELLDRGTYLAHRAITPADLEAGELSLAFAVDAEAGDDWDAFVEPRVRTFVEVPLVIHAIRSEVRGPIGETSAPSLTAGTNWLNALVLGPAGRWNSSCEININSNEGELVAYGPYWALLSGRYELQIAFDPAAGSTGTLVIEVVSGDRFRGETRLAHGGNQRTAHLVFEVHDDEAEEPLPIEVRLRAEGALSGKISHARVRRIGDAVGHKPWTKPPLSDQKRYA